VPVVVHAARLADLFCLQSHGRAGWAQPGLVAAHLRIGEARFDLDAALEDLLGDLRIGFRRGASRSVWPPACPAPITTTSGRDADATAEGHAQRAGQVTRRRWDQAGELSRRGGGWRQRAVVGRGRGCQAMLK